MIKRFSLETLKPAFSQDAIIIVPNNRLKDALINSFADSQGSRVYHAPQVISIDVWIRRVWEQFANLGLFPFSNRLPISSTEELFLWIGILEDASAKTPLLNPEETARSVSYAYQLMRQWKLEEQHLDELLSYRVLPDIASFLDWKKQFEMRCDKKKVVSLADCLALINTHFSACDHSTLEGSFFLFGFFSPPPLYADLFDHLARFHDVEYIEPSLCKRPLVKTHFTFDSWAAELDSVCQWAREKLCDSPDSHIGIVGELNAIQLSDIKLRIECELNPHALLDFGRASQKINSNQTGNILIQEPIIHDALLAIGLIREQQSGEDLCRLIHSPFLVVEKENVRTRFELERVIRNQLTVQCRMNDFLFFTGETQKKHHCPRLFQALGTVRKLQRRHSKLTSSADWMRLFEDILKAFGWPGTNLTHHQAQVLERWQNIMEQFAALSTVTGPFDLNKALSSLRLLCRSTQTQQYFSQRANISIYKTEEAVGLEFDHLWLINMNDQAWPPNNVPSPFLPYRLQFEQKIPGSHSAVQYAHAESVFDTLSHSAKKSMQSSHHKNDDGQEFRPSSFVADFIQKCHKKNPVLSLQPLYGRQNYGSQVFAKSPDDDQLNFLPLPQAVGGHQVLSDQSSCPFKAFAKHRLNASPLTRFGIGISAAERGTALHNALEYLFGKLSIRESLQALSHDELTSLCNDAADLAVGYLRQVKKTLMTPTFLRIEKDRTAALLIKFLTDSKGEAGRLHYSIEEKEKKHHWPYDDLHFSFKVDRVDKLDNEALAIIDYKTGKTSASSTSWLADRPEDLQIPFYFTAMSSLQDSPVGAISLVYINPAKIEYKGLSSEENFHTQIKASSTHGKTQKSWSQLSETFLSQIARFAQEFKSGLVCVDPVDPRKSCRYCGLQGLCRIEELTEATPFDPVNASAGDLHG